MKPIASPIDAVRLANERRNRTIVFFAAGFETTMAPVAGMLAAGVPNNLLLLLSGRLTWPAVSMLLDSATAGFDALIAPGHVATVMGSEEWQFVVDKHHLPTAVAGFTPESLLAAFYSVLRQHIENIPFLDNCYPEVVTAHGNMGAKKVLYDVMDIADANWRGIGTIPDSGFVINDDYAAYDARKHFSLFKENTQRKRAGEMPPGCDCAQVVLGKIYPNECRIFGKGCTPHRPIGPCMVSDEGACRIWWSGGTQRERVSA
ncbi:MAG: hydrogenase formation protein HypD [Gammaproteobacteria bacterium]|nr:hydrogenase formation protein HypD [Gammaproteobacteria bacterium]